MRWFLPLMAVSGVAMSLTAPLEVLLVREFWHTGLFIGVFMLSSAVGVIVVDVFGTRLVPGLDAKVALTVGLVLFGIACIGLGLATEGVLLMTSRVLQGFGGGVFLGAGLQAAVRVGPVGDGVASSVGRFNVAFLFGAPSARRADYSWPGSSTDDSVTRPRSSSPECSPWSSRLPWLSRCRR